MKKSIFLAAFALATLTTQAKTNHSNGNRDQSEVILRDEWDQMLDDYEAYVDKYLEFYKKAMQGDASALSEYPALMEKATKLQESMQKAQQQNELSSAQLKRFMEIQTKMTNALLSN